jgi:hemoglobin-like flavoprotein
LQQPAHTIAQHSYSRCLRAPDFFGILYDRLLASDPAIPPMFAQTEFPRQHKLLQHGLGLLLSYCNKPDAALLDRIAARHSSRGIDVPPAMYEHFVESLLHAVRESDPRFDDDVEVAWREAVRPGLDFMKARYET